MTIVQNGTLVTPGGMLQADLAMEDGKITAIAPGLPAQGAARVDASVSFRLSTLLAAAALFLIRGGMAALPTRREKTRKQSRNRAKAAQAPFANHKTKERAGA